MNLRGFLVAGLLLLPVVAHALEGGYWTWVVSGSSPNTKAEITKYTGPGGTVVVPDQMGGVPVYRTGRFAFGYSPSAQEIINIILPSSLTDIGANAFTGLNLTSITIPSGVTFIGPGAFYGTDLTSIRIPNSVTSLGAEAFRSCPSLNSVTIPSGITSIGSLTFANCPSLSSVYFKGNAPDVNPDAFTPTNYATIYYLPETSGWGATFCGRPTVLWNPKIQTSDSRFGVQSNRFGFNITGTNFYYVTVEACTNLTSGSWKPLQTGAIVNGPLYFSDAQWRNYPGRFYRLRMP